MRINSIFLSFCSGARSVCVCVCMFLLELLSSIVPTQSLWMELGEARGSGVVGMGIRARGEEKARGVL